MKIGLFFVAALATLFSTGWTAKTKMVCYYGSWATYRSDRGQFTSEKIDPSLCTHVIYAYTGVGPDGGINILDSYLALPDNYGKDDFRKFVEMKRFNKDMKMMVGIGGYNQGSGVFSRIAASPQTRQYFVRSVVNFMNTYRFDGLSVDWMYPGGEGGSPLDKQNFVALLQELKKAFASHWVLSIIGTGNEQIFERGYDVPGISSVVDFVSLLSFDYHGSWESLTGLNAPLFPRRSETGDSRKGNQDFSVNMWMKKGMDANKLILGIPTYGRTFTLQDISRKGISVPAVRPGQQGPYTQQPGTLGYNELVEKFKQEGSWVVEWDNDANVPYAHRGDFWISYDNENSVGLKADYILKQGLGGAMIMQLETDDFQGVSGTRFALINAVKKVLESGTLGSWSPPTETWTWAPVTQDPNPWSPSPVTWNPITSGPHTVVCKKPGLLRDPTNCSRYYVCQPTHEAFQLILSHCPETLAFDENSQTCKYRYEVPGC